MRSVSFQSVRVLLGAIVAGGFFASACEGPHNTRLDMGQPFTPNPTSSASSCQLQTNPVDEKLTLELVWAARC